MATALETLGAFAILTPINAAAKAAFSHVVEDVYLNQLPMHGRIRDYMRVDAQQSYHGDVARMRRDAEREDDETATEPDTDAETRDEWQNWPTVWTGSYYLTVTNLPFPREHWRIGKMRHNTPVEFPLAMREASLKSVHATFNYCKETRCLQIRKPPRASLDLSVNGHDVLDFCTIVEDRQAIIQFGNLKYQLAYTDYAYDQDYYTIRDEFMLNTLQWQDTKPNGLTQTPSSSATKIGEWAVRTPAGTYSPIGL